MNTRVNDIIQRNTVFAWIALVTVLVLLVPLTAMQLTDQVNWDPLDFTVMGVLVFGTSSLFVLAARRLPARRRLILGLLFTIAFLYVWAELAVGIFTNAAP